MWTSCLFLALFVTVQGRAVNISNTWVLPEEGFPVFYRYFRDRISWYEADAVCQFHHANLVTVDTTAQYDAVRAYLKELDISSAVWIGLIRSNPDGDFTWTDYRGLGGEGYWSSAPDSRTAPLCAAADPTADYRWDARACGGPSVASFICELPVPQWALGNEGCMVKALPALTILYLPESAAVQLTTDCGLAGVRRVQCTGNVKRDDLLKDLSCSVDEPTSTASSVHDISPNWQVTTNTFSPEQENNDMTPEDDITTSPEVIEQENSVKSTTMQDFINLGDQNQLMANQYESDSKYDKVPNLNLIENNNLINNIPSIIMKDDLSSTEYVDKLENDRHIQHKLLHDELARLGNLETIFHQPTDHFIPPLVIAKAKLSNDMTAMSFEEKLAQEHEGSQFMKHSNEIMKSINKGNELTTESQKYKTTENVLNNIMHSTIHDNKDKVYTKKVTPKKYHPKHTKFVIDAKRKLAPTLSLKKIDENVSPSSLPMTSTKSTAISSDEHIYVSKKSDSDESDETSIELTVIIREPTNLVNYTVNNNTSYETGFKSIETSYEFLNSTELHDIPNENSTVVTLPNIIILNDEIINITFNTNHATDSTSEPISGSSDISTKFPKFKVDPRNSDNLTTQMDLNFHGNVSFDSNSNLNYVTNNPTDVLNTNDVSVSSESSMGENTSNIEINSGNNESHGGLLESKMIMTNVAQDLTTNIDMNETITSLLATTEQVDSNIEQHLNSNSSEDEIDDFQSPLLSGADEPIHKSIRARRPQTPQNRGNKFNPFRILG